MFPRSLANALISAIGLLAAPIFAACVLASPPDEEMPERARIVIPEEGLTDWERHFLICLQEMDSIHFESSSIRDVTVSLRRLFIKLHDLDFTSVHVKGADLSIEYDIHPELPDLFTGISLSHVNVVYSHEAKLVVYPSSVHSRLWRRVKYEGLVNDEGRFVPPVPIQGKPVSDKAKAIHIDFHSSGRPSRLAYYLLVDRVLYICDHQVEWNENGDVVKNIEYEVPQPLTIDLLKEAPASGAEPGSE